MPDAVPPRPPPEGMGRFVPIALAKPALAAALGIDGGAVFQILAVENLGLSPAAIGVAFGLGLLSLPLQLWAARTPLRKARRNLQAFLLLAAAQIGLLAWLLAIGATGGVAATALVVTVTAEVSISVLFTTAWQPLLAKQTSSQDRQRINAGWSALGRGLLAGLLVVFSATDARGRSLLLLGLAAVAVGVAAHLGRLEVPADHAQGPPATAALRSLTQPLRWVCGGFVAVNLASLPLWLVYLSEVLWPDAELGVVGAIQAAAVVAALLAWRTTDGDVGRRARCGALLVFAGSMALVAVGRTATTGAEHAVVLAVTLTTSFGAMYASLALLEMAHRLVAERNDVVAAFTLVDVVDSSSLQAGLFVAGLLITWSTRATVGPAYIAFLVILSGLAVGAVGRVTALNRGRWVRLRAAGRAPRVSSGLGLDDLAAPQVLPGPSSVHRLARRGGGLRLSSGTRWRLVVSDLDGTLVTGTTALDHLRAWIGHRPALEDVEDRLAAGGLTDREVAQAHAPWFRGIAVADAAEAMASVPSIDGIAEGVSLLRQRSVDAFIATVSWSFAAQSLARMWGFTQVCGAELEVDDAGLFTGRVSRHFSPDDKAAFVSEHCSRAGFGLHQVVAVGDGRSDLSLFRAVGFSVALNASSEARAAADAVVDDDSFVAALRAVPGLLDQGRRERGGTPGLGAGA